MTGDGDTREAPGGKAARAVVGESDLGHAATGLPRRDQDEPALARRLRQMRGEAPGRVGGGHGLRKNCPQRVPPTFAHDPVLTG